MSDLATLVPLHDLGQVRPEWAGILSPLYDDETIRNFIQEQFLSGAATYAERYQNTAHWRDLLERARKRYTLPSADPLILDIGSGAGNSVFPLLEMYPAARLVASDLSVPLLKILRDYLVQHHRDRDIQVVQLNAEQLVFADGQFDLVVGGSILHHLLAPEKAVAECFRVLRPGGAAVFFEPFELGNQLIALALRHLLFLNGSSDSPAGRALGVASRLLGMLTRFRKRFGGPVLPPAAVRLFQALCRDYEVRKGSNKLDPLFCHLDDKWLFTRTYFEELAQSTGFGKVVLFPINSTDHLISRQVQVLLRLGAGLSGDVLPDWANRSLQEMDAHFSAELRQELIIEACVLFRKAPATAVSLAA